MAYNNVGPVSNFPNWIFCTKIVPLVYDDCLSYMEFLNKLMVKLNEVINFANSIDANVDELKEVVDRIAILVDGFDERITANEGDIANLKTAMETVNTVIEGINSTLTDMQGDIDSNAAAIENLAQDVEREINTAIGPLQSTVASLSITVASNTSRIATLEEAAFDPSQIVMSNYPFNFAISTLNGNSNGLRIVVDGSGAASDSIQWVDGGQYAPSNIPTKQKFNTAFKVPRFYSSGNAAHLVIPNVFPIKYGANINWNLYFYANRWSGVTNANTGIVKVGSIPFTELLADGGYTLPSGVSPSANTACFNEMELFPNESTGCYDLYIYNGRNGHYTWINDYIPSSIMVLPLDLGTMTQAASIQKYFNLLNTYMIQTTGNVDGQIANAKSEMESYTRVYASTQDAIIKQECLLADILNYDLNLDPALGVSVTRENTKYTNYEFDSETRHYKVTKMDVSMVLSLTGLTSGTDFTIGSLQNNYLPIAAMSGNHYLSLDIMNKTGNGYCTILSDGTIAVNITADTSTPTTVRIYGYFVDYIKTNLT